MSPRKSYVGAAPETTLVSDITTASTTIAGTDLTGWPSPSGGKLAGIVIDPGLATEEKIEYDTRTGNSMSGCLRGRDNTSPAAHSAGAVIRHVYFAQDAEDANGHIFDTALDQHTQYHTAARHAAVSHTTAMIGDGQITTAKILDANVTLAKLGTDVLVNRAVTSGTRPASPVEGQRIYETDTDKELTYSGSAWVEMGDLGAWETYTPVWTAAGTPPALGDGTIVGSYRIIGKTMFLNIKLTMGSTTTFGTGAYYLSLPSAGNVSTSKQQIMQAWLDNAGVAVYNSTARCGVTGFGAKVDLFVTTGVTETSPFTWGDGDSITVQGVLEIT